MADTKIPEYQQELFTEFSPEPSSPKRSERLPGIAKPQKPILMSLTVEQILLAGIGLILICCFSFFMGVLRGKSIASLGETAPASSQTAPLLATTVRQAPVQAQAPRVSVAAKPAQAPAQQPVPVPARTATLPQSPQKQPFIADLSKPYTIQLVTYKQKELGDKEVAYFRSKGYYSSLIPNGDYFVVCVGQYATKEEAKRDLKLFGAKYKDCFLRRR